MLDARHNGYSLLIGGVEPAPILKLVSVWDYDVTNRVVRVIPIDKRQIIIVDPKVELVGHIFQFGSLLLAQLPQLLNFCNMPAFNGRPPFYAICFDCVLTATLIYYFGSRCYVSWLKITR